MNDDTPYTNTFPDGLVVGGVFYPLETECPEEFDSQRVTPCGTCDGSGMVRNPAIEWVWICSTKPQINDTCASLFGEEVACYYDTLSLASGGSHSPFCRWVSVGLIDKVPYRPSLFGFPVIPDESMEVPHLTLGPWEGPMI